MNRGQRDLLPRSYRCVLGGAPRLGEILSARLETPNLTGNTLLAYTRKDGSRSDDGGGDAIFLRKASGLLTDGERERLIGFVGANPRLRRYAGIGRRSKASLGRSRQWEERRREGNLLFSQRSISGFFVNRVREKSESELDEGRTERPESARVDARQELSQR